MVPPTPAEAEIFHRMLSSGRNEALLVSARGANGLFDCVVKLTARLGLPPIEYLSEWVAAAVGRELGLAIPEPMCVGVSEAFADAILDETVRADVLRSCVPTFGLAFVRAIQYVPSPTVHPDVRAAASELLLFDVLVHNFDRVPHNPNLLQAQRDVLVPIDHELAFEFLHPPPRDDPGKDPRIDLVRRHLFGQALRGKVADLTSFRHRVRALSDVWFEGLVAATPPEWTVGDAAGCLDRIVDVMRERRDHIDGWLGAVLGAMR
jgi:hypothetical protein